MTRMPNFWVSWGIPLGVSAWLIETRSKIGIQAGAEAQLHNDGSLWNCIQYHGTSPVDCLDALIFYTRRPCGNGLGMVSGFGVHLCCRGGNGGPWICDADVGWFILVVCLQAS